MTSPMHDRIEQAMAEFERNKAAIEDLQNGLAATHTTISPKNRSISVTVDGQGELTEVKFPSNAYRGMSPAQLGSLIVDTVTEAREEARRKSIGMFQSLLPAGLPVGDMLSGPVDFDDVMEQITDLVRDAQSTIRKMTKEDDAS